MIITDNLYYNIKANTSLAFGFFDGIHSGHKKVLQNALDLSKKLGTRSVILTFENHPIELLFGIKPEFITTPEERLEIFKQMGFDAVIMANFSKEIANLSANQYFNKYILKFAPKSISIGYNHKFGVNNTGNINYLESMSKLYDFILNVEKPVKTKNEVISSTLIRNLIKSGEVKKASLLLEKPYKVRNIVIKGVQRGRTINYPTANLMFPENKIIPKFGVYTGIITIDGLHYNAIANVGLRPTFADIDTPLIEIHILNFKSDIYGKMIEFSFIEKLRDEMKFKNIQTLKEQIQIDLNNAKF